LSFDFFPGLLLIVEVTKSNLEQGITCPNVAIVRIILTALFLNSQRSIYRSSSSIAHKNMATRDTKKEMEGYKISYSKTSPYKINEKILSPIM
jgi:hypothetical protein